MSNLDTPAAVKSKPNLLSSFYRQPKIFIKLPSEGKFYPQAAVDSSATGEYAVYAMTAKDELMLKTPAVIMPMNTNLIS